MSGTRKFVGKFADGSLWKFLVRLDGNTVEQKSNEYG